MDKILQFVSQKVPDGWQAKDIESRKAYWLDPVEEPTKERRTICALEVWCELLGRDREDITRADVRQINLVLSSLEGFSYSTSADCGPYGRQRAFVKPVLPAGWTRIASLGA